MKIHVTAIFFHICYSFGNGGKDHFSADISDTSPISTSSITTSSTSSCFQWEIEYLIFDSYISNVKSSPEECQSYCNDNHYCEYWTWYSNKDYYCQMFYYAGICYLSKTHPDPEWSFPNRFY